jgi:hypothetical protein
MIQEIAGGLHEMSDSAPLKARSCGFRNNLRPFDGRMGGRRRVTMTIIAKKKDRLILDS